jgi:small ubiquitin-related modifier
MSDSEQEIKPNPQEEDVKPDVKPDTHINLKVSDGSNEVFFKIKRSTPLRRLMEAFAKRQGKSLSSLRFLNEGQRLNPDETPDDLDLEDNDVIEAHQEQVSVQWCNGASFFFFRFLIIVY